MTTGDRIKSLRIENNMTQEELGKKLGIVRSAVLKYEKDEIVDLPASKLNAIADLFGVSVDFLLGRESTEKQLADEARTYSMIQRHFGKNAVKLMAFYTQLNAEGQNTAVNTLEDLTLIDKYTRP